jgi:NADH-dependent peroxiredoxin subunit F
MFHTELQLAGVFMTVLESISSQVETPVPEVHPESKAVIEAPSGGTYDAIIAGGGPAGITCGIYLMRKMVKTLMITPDLGGQVNWTPLVENYPGYRDISGFDLVEKYKAQLEQYPINLRLGDRVVAMEMRERGGVVRTEMGAEYAFFSLVIASGKQPRKLGVPGEDTFYGKGITHCVTCDGPLYRGQPVAVIGGGNSALSAALDLLAIGCTVYVIDIAPELQADRILAGRVLRHDAATVLLNHQVTGIYGNDTVNAVSIKERNTGIVSRIDVNGVFIEIGLEPNSRFAMDVVATNAHREIIVNCRCMTDVMGVFAAGDVTNVPSKQIVIAAGEGAKAALGVNEYLKKSGI